MRVYVLQNNEVEIKNDNNLLGLNGFISTMPAKHQGKKKIILPYNVEILAFADEEGVRFPTALMGPRSLAGTFNKKDLKLKDKNNISILRNTIYEVISK